MNKEIWKDVKGYEGKYQVSNLGRIKSIKFKNGNQEKILKLTDCKGYKIIRLCKDGIVKSFKVHRLVAQAFIPNYNNMPIINHINGIKNDNNVENLEWCTYSHNETEAHRMGLKKPTWQGKCYYTHPSNRKIIQYNLNGEKVKEWSSIQEATDKLNVSNISAVCRGAQKTAGGYIWKYTEVN